MQDYPGRLACIVWFADCNMRCRYCHNADLVNQKGGFMEEETLFDFLKTKVGLLDGVVLSGGECTLYAGLDRFIGRIRGLGFAVKIDTNGLNYSIVRRLVEDRLVDAVALDFKAPKSKFTLVTQLTVTLYDEFEKTLKFLVNSLLERNIYLEIRTTVHTSLLGEDDINGIIKILDDLGYSGTFFLQNFRDNDGKTLSGLAKQDRTLSREKICRPKHFILGYRNF